MQGDARQLVKEGRVTTVYPKNHTVRVEFEDKDGLVSAEMPVLTMCAFGDKFYSMPDVNDKVIVLFASNADQTGEGWVIGSRFHDNSTPNADSIDKTRLDFKDKTSVEYDRDKNTMKIAFKDKSTWTYDADKSKFEFKFKDGSLIQHDAGNKQMQISVEGDLRIKAKGTIFINGTQIYLDKIDDEEEGGGDDG